MNNDFTIAKIEDIDRQIALLLYKPCECDLHLEIKIRVFGGGEHYVRQCNNCGRQKGGALKAIDALDELKGLPLVYLIPPLKIDIILNHKYALKSYHSSHMKNFSYYMEKPHLYILNKRKNIVRPIKYYPSI